VSIIYGERLGGLGPPWLRACKQRYPSHYCTGSYFTKQPHGNEAAPRTVSLSWQDSYISKMSYKQGCGVFIFCGTDSDSNSSVRKFRTPDSDSDSSPKNVCPDSGPKTSSNSRTYCVTHWLCVTTFHTVTVTLIVADNLEMG